MSEQINIFCVKWVPLEEPWRHNGSMYLDAHVYDLRNQMFNVMEGKDFHFYLLTNHTAITDTGITIIDITKCYNYERIKFINDSISNLPLYPKGHPYHGKEGKSEYGEYDSN